MAKIKKLIVAIDGPAGAGKSTIAKIVAREMSYLYIDTGAMYRALTWKALETQTHLHDEAALVDLAKRSKIALKQDKKGLMRVFVDREEVSGKIRSERVSRHTNEIAKVQGVREILRNKQHLMGRTGGVVMEGRDIGTAVFPKAQVKFYLDASPHERALRRYHELKAKGKRVSLERIAHALAQRDYKDKNRGISPLMAAPDAIVIDSTSMTLEQVAKKILNFVRINEAMQGKK